MVQVRFAKVLDSLMILVSVCQSEIMLGLQHSMSRKRSQHFQYGLCIEFHQLNPDHAGSSWVKLAPLVVSLWPLRPLLGLAVGRCPSCRCALWIAVPQSHRSSKEVLTCPHYHSESSAAMGCAWAWMVHLMVLCKSEWHPRSSARSRNNCSHTSSALVEACKISTYFHRLHVFDILGTDVQKEAKWALGFHKGLDLFS